MFENRDFETSFQVLSTFSCNLSFFEKKQRVVLVKQHVVRSVSMDVFQILSDEIFISSKKIEKKSEKIGKNSRIRVRFVGRMILNSRSVHSSLPSLHKILTKILRAF